MRKTLSFFMGLFFGGLMALSVHAETYQLSDGTSLTGSIISFNENGPVLRLEDGKYSDRVAWSKFSQDNLKKFQADPKIAALVEPFIEVSQEEAAKKTEPPPRKDPPRLERPAKQALLVAMLSSSLGLMVGLLLYAANIYAGYEVAIYRAQQPALVCGVAAIAPVIGPIIFLCISTKPGEPEQVAQEVVAAQAQRFAVTESEPTPEEQHARGLHLAQAAHAESGGIPAPQVFPRGQFMFNRRFFETKFPGFFSVVRRAEDRDMVLLFKTARGQYVGRRIARITAAELHLQVQQGAASQEVMIPFAEIQEVQFKHKDA